MTRETIQFNSPEEWLNLRGKDITSTASSALFGLSPYQTEFEVYHFHKNKIKPEFKVTDRMEKGNRLEAAIAEEVALQEGWTDLKPFKVYMRIPGERIGSSFDFEAIDRDGSPLLVEIKAVDYFRFKDTWSEDEAPPHIEIQCQHELLVADRFPRVAIVACTGIYDYRVIYRDRDIAMGEAIRKRVAKFWQDVKEGNEPAINYERDAEVIKAMFPNLRPEPVDMTDDAVLEDVLARYELAAMQEREFAKAKDAAKAEIHHRLGNSAVAFTERYKVTAGKTKDTPDRVAEPGEVIKGRKGYRQCLVKQITPKEG
jgi:predicted phage-related endonuclease